MTLLSINEFQHALRVAFSFPTFDPGQPEGPEIRQAWVDLYGVTLKTLKQVQVETVKVWKGLETFVRILEDNHPYLDTGPFKKALDEEMRDKTSKLNQLIKTLKKGPQWSTYRQAGLLSFHPAVLAAKAFLKVTKLLYQKLRKAKDADALVAVQDIKEIIKGVELNWTALMALHDGMFYHMEKVYKANGGHDPRIYDHFVLLSPMFEFGKRSHSPKLRATMYQLEIQAKTGPGGKNRLMDL